MTDPRPTPTDEDMRRAVATAKRYTAVILSAGPAYGTPEAAPSIWEHGRRNFALRADGIRSFPGDRLE